MAYTYDDFVKAATNAGAMDRFSEDDLKITRTSPEYGLSMLKLYQDEQNATTAEQKLLTQEAANQLRKTYGSSYNPLTPSFSYKGQTEYQKLLDSVANPTPFSYDPTQDPRYSAYRKGYLREADRAREDTLATVSAGSGGVPSSYAVAAAQQAGDYHVGKLNDVIPTLYQDALNNYYTEQNQKLNALGALNTDRNFDYSAYLQQAEKDLQAAELMAGKGDYSLLGQYLGLTPEQMALLQGKKSGSPKKTGDKKVINVTKITDKELWDTMSAIYGEHDLWGKGYHYFDE